MLKLEDSNTSPREIPIFVIISISDQNNYDYINLVERKPTLNGQFNIKTVRKRRDQMWRTFIKQQFFKNLER